MALVVPNVGEVEILKRTLGDSTSADVTIHLYKTTMDPIGETAVAGDFTELSDPADQGYAAVLCVGTWTYTGGAPSDASYPQITWTFDGVGTALTVYGYFVTDGSGLLVWAEEFTDAPYNIPDTGGAVSVTPKLELE